MSNIYFTPARALQALVTEADEAKVRAALEAVIAELPEELTATYDMGSRDIADTIFTALLEGGQE